MRVERRKRLTQILDEAALYRGASLTVEEAEGYLKALEKVDPENVRVALMDLWREVDSRVFPTPAAIIAKVREKRRYRSADEVLKEIE